MKSASRMAKIQTTDWNRGLRASETFATDQFLLLQLKSVEVAFVFNVENEYHEENDAHRLHAFGSVENREQYFEHLVFVLEGVVRSVAFGE